MAHYFLSDVHLRLDRPDRGERLAHFVRGLHPTDTLVIVGDLCDFWLASRQIGECMAQCAGLQALADHSANGGQLTILAGNHDASLGAFYERQLAARFHSGPLDVVVSGVRLHLVHGHETLREWHWKRFLETRFFRGAFSLLPNAIAHGLANLLDSVNDGRRPKSHARMLNVYRAYVAVRDATADMFLFGHVHERVDEQVGTARLIVLGDWKVTSSYLKVDDQVADFLS